MTPPPRDNISSTHDIPPVSTSSLAAESSTELPLETITVYLTGFGAFGTVKDNPSYNIVSAFDNHPGFFLTSPTRRLKIVPKTHPTPIKVSYEGVANTIPEIYSSQEFNYIIHVGVGSPGGYTLEMKAHATGYNSRARMDVDGKTLEDTQFITSPGVSKGSPSTTTDPATTLYTATRALQSLSSRIPEIPQTRTGTYGWAGDEIDLCNFVRKNLNGPDNANSIGEPIRIRPSRDAGRYLCEWIYWCSCREALTNPPSIFSPPSSPVASRSKAVGEGNGSVTIVHPTPISPSAGGTDSGPFSTFLDPDTNLHPPHRINGNRNDFTPSPVPGLVPEDTIASPRNSYYGGYTNGAQDALDELDEEMDNEGAEYVTENVKRTKRVLFVHVPADGEPYFKADGVRVLEQVIVGMVREGERLKGRLDVESLVVEGR